MVGGDIPDAVRCAATIRSRFSTLRYMKVIKRMNPIQRGHVIRNGFSFLLQLPEHLMIPMTLTQWLLDHISYDGVFQHKSKTFVFNKEMINVIFGFDDGHIPFVFNSDDPAVIEEVNVIRAKYGASSELSMERLVSIMLGDNTEVGFMRSFILFFISTILCPLTYNGVNLKYLFSLRDVSQFRNLNYASLCYDHLFTEVEKFKEKRFDVVNSSDYNRRLWVGGCLPVFGVSNSVVLSLFFPDILFCSFLYFVFLYQLFICTGSILGFLCFEWS